MSAKGMRPIRQRGHMAARALLAITIALLLLGSSIQGGDARQSGRTGPQEQFARTCDQSGGRLSEGFYPDRNTSECMWFGQNGSSNSLFCVFSGPYIWYCYVVK